MLKQYETFQVHDLADRGYLTPEQLNNLSAMRRREPVSGGVGASGSVGSAGDISGMSGASKIVEANRLASNTNSPHDMREALKLLFSITSYDVTATATSSVDEQLLHYNQQVNIIEFSFNRAAWVVMSCTEFVIIISLINERIDPLHLYWMNKPKRFLLLGGIIFLVYINQLLIDVPINSGLKWWHYDEWI